MATYLYTGSPTYGKATKDIKVPNSSGGFTVYTDVTPNTTEIVTSDETEIDYLDKYSNTFSKQS